MKSLYQDYRKFEKIAKKFNRESSTLDISNEDFLPPTTLIPLTCLQEQMNRINYIIINITIYIIIYSKVHLYQ